MYHWIEVPLIWLIAALSFHNPVYAAPPDVDPAQSVSVGDLLDIAYKKNPSIQAALEAWRGSIEKLRVVTGYPDPVLSVNYFPEPIETRLGPQDWNLSLSQAIPFPGKLSKAGEVAQADARIAKLMLDITVRDVMTAVRESFHELLYIREAKRSAKENSKLLDHLRTVGETAYAENRALLLDMVKAQSQVGQLRYDILLMEELDETEKTQLNSLLDRPPGALFGPLLDEPFRQIVFDLESLYTSAEENEEEIRMAGVEIEKAGVKVDLAGYGNLPEFRVGAFYAAIGEPDVLVQPPDAGRDAFGIQAGMTLPIWFGKNTGRTAAAQAEMRSVQSRKRARVNRIRAEVRTLFFRLKNSERLIQLYQKELIPQAAKAMELAEVWFRAGESSFSDFVETQSVWYNFQLSFARARADYGKYLARLERLAGKSLTHREEAPESR
jgi:outer membrane protein TolC